MSRMEGGARRWRAGMLLALALLVALAAGCRRDTDGQLPEPGGEKIQARRAQIEGFALVGAYPDQKQETLAIALECRTSTPCSR
jgi:alpha-2-macroglobulin